MRALITGITGQDGAYLAELLLSKNYEVYGLVARRVNNSYYNLRYLNILDKVKFCYGDMTDPCSINNAIKSVKPDEVYNLAAQSFVGESWNQPIYTSQVNGMGCIYMLEAIRNFCPEAKFYQASTSEMYGNNWEEDYSQNEKTPFKPRSPYGTAKVMAHNSTVNYRESYGLFACAGILFNHESPIRGKEFVTRKVTDAVARISLGLQDTVELGNLNSRRDWGYSKDYVEAMWMMLQQPEPDDFVIATGKAHSIRDLLEVAFSCVRLDFEKHVAINPDFVRPAEVTRLRGDITKARNRLNWEPKTDFADLIHLMVQEDIKRYDSNKLQ
jgi:GDPmannose 4,6-dehydratase